MQSHAIYTFVSLAIVVVVVLVVVYAIEFFTEKRKLNVQKIILDSSCLFTVFTLAIAIDDKLNWHGDFKDLIFIFLVMLSSMFSFDWAYPVKRN